MKKHVLYILFICTCSAAFAENGVQSTGRISTLECIGPLHELARKSVDRKHPGRVGEIHMGYPEEWTTLLKNVHSDGLHVKFSNSLIAKFENEENLPPILKDTVDAYKKLKAEDAIGVCAVGAVCTDGGPLGNPKAWLTTVHSSEFKTHSQEGDIVDNSIMETTPEQRAKIEQIKKQGAPKYLLTTEGLLPENTPQSGVQAVLNASNFWHEVRHAADFELMNAWTKENLRRINAGQSPDALFAKYGRIDNIDGKDVPSIDAGFMIAFTETRAWNVGLISMATIHPQFRSKEFIETNSQVAWNAILKTGPGTERALAGQTPTTFFKQGSDWAQQMKQTVDEAPKPSAH